MGDAKSLAAESIQKLAVQRLAWCVGNRVNKAVKSIPVFAQIDEQLIDIIIAADVALKNQFAAKSLGHILHTAVYPFTLIGESEFRTFAVHGLCDTVGDRAVADHAGNQNAFVGQKSHAIPL